MENESAVLCLEIANESTRESKFSLRFESVCLFEVIFNKLKMDFSSFSPNFWPSDAASFLLIKDLLCFLIPLIF